MDLRENFASISFPQIHFKQDQNQLRNRSAHKPINWILVKTGKTRIVSDRVRVSAYWFESFLLLHTNIPIKTITKRDAIATFK